LKSSPWIRDHEIQRKTAFPSAGYLTIVGAAVRQLTGAETYSIGHCNSSSALILLESRNTEMMTTLRPTRLTSSLDSEWYNFSICSYKNTEWTKRCFGQAESMSEQPLPGRHSDSLPREVSTGKGYDVMRRVGMNYGPIFSGMTKSSAGVHEHTAASTVLDRTKRYELSYTIHQQQSISFQSLSVAISNGIPPLFNQLAPPIFIDGLHIRRPRGRSQVSTNARISPSGTMIRKSNSVADCRLIFALQGYKMSPLENEPLASNIESHAAVQLDGCPASSLPMPKP